MRKGHDDLPSETSTTLSMNSEREVGRQKETDRKRREEKKAGKKNKTDRNTVICHGGKMGPRDF